MRQLLAEIDSAELAEWEAFYALEPFGQDWLQTGMLAAVNANCHGGNRGKPFAPEDFTPQLRQHRAQTLEDFVAVFMAAGIEVNYAERA